MSISGNSKSKPKNKLSCPIGLECIHNLSPTEKRYICPNREDCIDIGTAWDIPYTYFKTADGCPILLVKNEGWRVSRWEKVSYSDNHLIRKCFIPGGYFCTPHYDDFEEQWMSERIVESWKSAGWESAIAFSAKLH